MLLDIAKRTGTHNVTNGTANGRTMISGVTTNTPTSGTATTNNAGYIAPTLPSSGPYLSDGVYRPTPADGDDYTFDTPLTYAALVAQVYRLQNEMAGLAAQVVELREKLERWEGD